MRLNATALLLTLSAILSVDARAGDLPSLSDQPGPFSFVVLGDVHYTPPEYKVASFIHQLGKEVAAEKPLPAFVCQTGDFVEGGVYVTADGRRKFVQSSDDEMRAQITFAMDDLTKSFPCPVFIAVGNHDKHGPSRKAYNEIALPILARQLRQPLAQTFYAFRYGSACFVFLDFAPPDYEEQARFLEKTLAAAKQTPGLEHVFLFAHYPLWPVVRAGFGSPRFTDSLLPLLQKHTPDAFFCGHTHNTLVCVREVAGQRITQIQGITVSPGKALIPIEQRRALLLPAAELPYCWGYMEGSQTGYYLVRVDGHAVDVQWRIPGQGTIRQFTWREPGQLRDVKAPAPAKPAAASDAALCEAKQAALVFCPWAENRTPIAISLNGQPVVETSIGPIANLFWEDKRIAIPPEKLGVVRRANQVEIANPSQAVFALAHLRLEVVLADGTTITTPVSSDFLFSCRAAQTSSAAQRKAVQAAPPHLLREVELGQPLPPVELRFP